MNIYDDKYMCIAAENNDIEMVKCLISLGGNVNSYIHSDHYPLHYAITMNNVEMVKYLVSEAGVDIIDTNYHDTLCDAVKTGHLEIVKYLFSQGADIEDYALNVALEKGHIEIAQYLISELVNYDAAFIYTVDNCHNELVKRLDWQSVKYTLTV